VYLDIPFRLFSVFLPVFSGDRNIHAMCPSQRLFYHRAKSCLLFSPLHPASCRAITPVFLLFFSEEAAHFPLKTKK